jgi:hypothetical protein
MERLNLRELERLLGIYAPFRLKEVSMDNEKEILTVRLEDENVRSKIPFRNIAVRSNPVIQWHHVRTGRYQTLIEIEPSVRTFSKGLMLNPPAFLGDKDNNYTYQLKQMVLMAAQKKLDSEAIATLLGVERKIVAQIMAEFEAEQQEQQVSALLPTESDPVWRAIIKHEISFKTNLAQLKFLISRLEIMCAKAIDDPGVLHEASSTLRQFFIKHKNQLKSEYAQIGVSQQVPIEAAPVAQTAVAEKKRVTLTLDHPVWDDVLSGKIDLLSKNMGFNLYITQLKTLYRKEAVSTTDKAQIVRELLFYLKKNMAKLKPELAAISRIAAQMNNRDSVQVLPALSHPVWQQILQGQIALSTQQMALKLLLVKARAAEDAEQACVQLREYFSRNSRILGAELKQLEQFFAVAS